MDLWLIMERENICVNTKKLAGVVLIASPLLSGCTPDQARSMVGAGVITTFLIGTGIIMYKFGERDSRKNAEDFQKKLQKAVEKYGNKPDVLQEFAQIDKAAKRQKIRVLLAKKK